MAKIVNNVRGEVVQALIPNECICGSEHGYPCYCDQVIGESPLGDKLTKRMAYGYFHAVCDPKDWKNPISAQVSPDILELVLMSVEFHTGVMCKEPVYNRNNGLFFVRNIGYRAGPCN